YWARRAARGGPAVAPGSPADELQLIDVRDLAPFLVRVGLGRETGALHAVGAEVRWGDFLRGVAERTGDRVQWRWAPAEVLARHGLRAWIDLPLWMPAVGPYRGACHVDRTLAMTAGLWTRDPAETAVDGWAWRQAHPGDPSGVGIDPEVEAKILAEL
ncbi:MAG: epimerase, partial [Deltaproteobacteria bacterium]